MKRPQFFNAEWDKCFFMGPKVSEFLVVFRKFQRLVFDIFQTFHLINVQILEIDYFGDDNTIKICF